MRTSKLLNLGSTLLVLCFGLSAWADDALESPVAEPGEATVVEPAPAETEPALAETEPALAETEPAPADAEPVLAETEPAPADAEAAPPAADSPAPAPVDAEEPWAAEAVEPESTPESPAEDPAESSSEAENVAEAPAPALGAVGYDSQGRPGRIHIVRSGDTLWDISDAYLGTPWVWPSIWQDNRDIENPHLIFPGDRIWITPSEMRKLTREQAEELLAGEPAAQQEGDVEVPVPVVPESSPVLVREEQPSYFVGDRERVGLVSSEAVDAAASVLANVSPRLMISESDRVWIGLGEADVSVGDEFTIFRIQERVYDPETDRALGYHVNFLGWLEVVRTDEESSLAVVRASASEIEIGDRLMPRLETEREITIQPSPGDVEGQISFLPNQRTHMGSLDYVYLNRGTLDGLEVGSPLHVYREGFRTRDEILDAKVQVPDRVVADLLVVRTQPEASVALVRRTDEELELGDRFRGSSN